jgi:hypothetical protein
MNSEPDSVSEGGADVTNGSEMQTARCDRAILPFGVVLLVFAVVRALFPFDGLYGQDAFAYFDFARAIWPHLRFGTPLPDLYWPRGYPVAVALLLPFSRGSPLAGQIVSVGSCAWAAAATFLLVRQLEDDTAHRRGKSAAALAAGLCVATSGAALRSSQVVMSDGLALGLTATAMVCVVRWGKGERGTWLVACSVALACGAVTRWLVGLVALPITAYVVIAACAGAGQQRRRMRWAWLAVAALAGLVILVPQLTAAHQIPQSLERHEWLARWSPGNMFARAFDTTEGHTHYRLPVGLFYLLRLGWPDYLFPTMAAFAVAGAWVICKERRAPAVALLLGWPLVVWLFISGIPYENPRFLLPTLPAIGALAGIGYEKLRVSLEARGRWLLTAVFALSAATGLGFGLREHAHTLARKKADLALVSWTAERVPLDATVLMAGETMVFEHYGSTHVRDTYRMAPAEVDALVAGGGTFFYLGDLAEVEGRWSGLGPQKLFEALRRSPGLTAVSTYSHYTLFRLGP